MRLRPEESSPEKSSGTGDQRQAVHGAGHVPQGVEDPVRRDQRLALTHDAAADGGQDIPDLQRNAAESRTAVSMATTAAVLT